MLFAQAAAEATAISNDNARAAPVAISGATGANADFINGIFEPTQEEGLFHQPLSSSFTRSSAAAAMSAGDCLFISGATGINAGAINGGYDRTGEMSGGYALYRKRCDPGIIMEHRDGDWEVKLMSDKGKDNCYAYVAGGCSAYEACTSRIWRVNDNGTWQDAPSAKMVTGSEAERQVERPAASTPSSNPPPPWCSPSLRQKLKLIFVLV